MTGTAKTEEKEFVEIYNLHVVEIPTNEAVARLDENDYIFKSVEAKWDAVVEDIVERHEHGQPVLVGTIAVETSEFLSEVLKRKGIPHNVLTPRSTSGRARSSRTQASPVAVTIATNMAGRGVDIKLGEGVVDSAACTCSAPSGTRRAGSTTSCAGARGAKGTRASRASTSPPRTISCVSSRATGSTGS